MMSSARVVVFGGDELLASILALGFQPVDDRPDIAVVDTRDQDALRRAAALPPATPRVFVAGAAEHGLIAALGLDPARLADSCAPAILGPVVMAALPARRRSATRVVVVTAVRGGAGRTLLATNLALRIAARMRVCLVDATGTGAAGWWLRREVRSWSTLEGLVEELTADHLSLLADEVLPGLRLVGGPWVAPTEELLSATTRAAAALDDLVIIDAPLAGDRLTRGVDPLADRTLLLAYDDPLSLQAVEEFAASEKVWLVASQSRAAQLGQRQAFRGLPRDESAIGAALARRERVGGRLGRAYDDLAQLLLIDAS